MIYTVKCCASTNLGSAFYTFPTGCRIGGGALTRRSNLVVVPYAPGTKETADGKIHGGNVTVSGRIWAANGPAAIDLVRIMEEMLLEQSAAFYVCQEYSGTAKYYPVHCCKSATHIIPEGPGGKWIDIDCVFPRGPNPAMIAV